jgi:hypothetical protein
MVGHSPTPSSRKQSHQGPDCFFLVFFLGTWLLLICVYRGPIAFYLCMQGPLCKF